MPARGGEDGAPQEDAGEEDVDEEVELLDVLDEAPESPEEPEVLFAEAEEELSLLPELDVPELSDALELCERESLR